MAKTYHIHPAIGIARLGNSTTQLCISPEKLGALPIDCDESGNARLTSDGKTERTISKFRDSEGRIKRQAGRFHICVHDNDYPGGRPLRIGDRIEGGGNNGTLVDIQWRVYLANKKAAWYEFAQLEGEHGYAPGQSRRNASIADSGSRQKLIIDPGPQTINCTDKRRASFSRGGNPNYAQTFPPELTPNSIDSLGDMMTDTDGRLLVLGGFGNSGSMKSGFEDPVIRHYANNDGWFDDTSDGPVMARLKFYVESIGTHRYLDVAEPAWVIVGYPAYVPQIPDVVTMDDVLYDLGVREFATETSLYGAPPFDPPESVDSADSKAVERWKAKELRYNPDYYPWFFRDIWPILTRPDNFTWLTNVLQESNFPHDQSERGTFYEPPLSEPPTRDQHGKITEDKFADARRYLYEVLRQPGEENQFRELGRPNSRTHNVPLMPLLAGDNPISNTVPSKFLRLTDTQLFILKQWARGRFINEKLEWESQDRQEPQTTGESLDHGALSNVLGGAFCPGGEAGWIMRNPSIYRAPYRIKGDPDFYNFRQTAASAYSTPGWDYAYETDSALSLDDDFDRGLQPGDITKHMALPWQADFNECSTQVIDITYEDFNRLYPDNPKDPRMKAARRKWETLWWPAHRPMQAFRIVKVVGDKPQFQFLDWAQGIPQTNAGDLKMVTEWKDLGFIVANPGDPDHKFISIEASDDTPVEPGQEAPEIESPYK